MYFTTKILRNDLYRNNYRATQRWPAMQGRSLGLHTLHADIHRLPHKIACNVPRDRGNTHTPREQTIGHQSRELCLGLYLRTYSIYARPNHRFELLQWLVQT